MKLVTIGNISSEDITLTRITNDTNGNPRYVVHFLDLLHPDDKGSIDERYKIAIKKANKIGGRKYSTKSYGGGVVFQSYSTPDLKRNIVEVASKPFKK